MLIVLLLLTVTSASGLPQPSKTLTPGSSYVPTIDEENLVRAAGNGNLSLVKHLIEEKGMDINLYYGYPLANASWCGQLEVVKYLLEAGANPNGTDDYEMKRDSYGGMPLKAAAIHNHLDVISLLLEAGATAKSPEESYGALELAAKRGHLEIVRRLLKAGADPNHILAYSLRIASENGHIDVVKALVGAGAHINFDAMVHGAKIGNQEIGKFLIESLEPEGKGYIIDEGLGVAAYTGDLDAVKFLLGNGANIQDGDALKFASQGGSFETVKLLLESGPNMTCRGASSACPWHYAARYGHPDLISLFAEYGANISSAIEEDIDYFMEDYSWPDGKGMTVMHVAAKFGYPMVQQLKDLGVGVNDQDARGRTPLQVAVQYRRAVVAKDLLKFCPDMTLRNKEGETVLDTAKALEAYTSKEELPSGTDGVLTRTLKETMPGKIAEAPFNDQSSDALGNEFLALLKTDSTLEERLMDVTVNLGEVSRSFSRLLEERSWEDTIQAMKDHNCKGIVEIGSEFFVKCVCLPGQGPTMTVTPVELAKQTLRIGCDTI